MARKQFLGVKLEPADMHLLQVMAQAFEGNASMTVRSIIRTEAARRGLDPQPQPQGGHGERR